MKVVKTIKLFIGGDFPRTESGRSYEFKSPKGETVARLCQSSRKDFRNAVDIAKAAGPAWSARSAYNKGQILYRMAEMAQGKRDELASIISESLDISNEKALKQVDAGIDQFVYYAGFSDKFQQVMGAINPINGPFHNFTTPSPTGVVTLIEGDKFNFGELTANISAALVGGNSLIVLLGKGCPAILATLAEVFATSDLPKGVVNLLTGHLDELAPVMAEHREVRALSFQNEREDLYFEMKEKGLDNLKRFIPRNKKADPLERILSTVEMQTVWHPIGV